MTASARLGVHEPREGTPEHPFVTAVLVARDGHLPWLRATVDAFLDQSRQADRLVVVDGTPDQDMREVLAREFPELREVDLTVVKANHEEAFAGLVDRAVQAIPARGSDHVVALRDRRRARRRPTHPSDRYHWLWLLHEDSAPTPDSLKALMRSVGRSERIGIAGCKINELDRPSRLINIGIDVTRSGRHVARTVEGELDQGQHDGRRDVLAVSSAGMLVRQDVYLDLGGFDPAFDGDGDGLDLCWRAHLADHAVVVVPEATAHQDIDSAHLLRVMEGRGTRMTRRQRHSMTRRSGDPDRPAAHSGSTLRRHRQVALARTSTLRFPFALAWATISSALLGVVLLLLKRPRSAASEFGQASAGLGLGRIMGARRRFRGRAGVSNAQLSSLFVPAEAGRAAAWDAVVAALTPGGSKPVHQPISTETGPQSEEAEEMRTRGGVLKRIVRHPGLWAVLVLFGMSLFIFRDALSDGALRGGHGLAGGELLPYFTSPGGVWHAWRDAWQGPGFGHAASSVPYLPFIAIGSWFVSLLPGVADSTATATAITWLFLAAPALAGWSAYLAGRAATKLAWPRALAALAWGSLAPLTTALLGGRLGPVIAHIVLPLALAGILRLGRSGATVAGTAATALAVTVLGAYTPILLPVLAIALLVVAVLGSSAAKIRALAVVVLVPLLLGHWSVEAFSDPSKLVGGPGVLTDGDGGAPLSALLFHPGGPGSTPLLLAVPVLFFGLWGALRGRGHELARWALVVLALVALAAALLAPRHSLGAPTGLHVWTGVPEQVAALSMLALALIGADRVHGSSEPGTRSATSRLGRLSVVTIALVMGGVIGLTAWNASAGKNGVQAVRNPAPAITVHEAESARAGMLLDLQPRSGAVTFTVRSREAGLPSVDPTQPAMQTPTSVTKAIAALVDSGAGERAQAAQTLRDAGIAFVAADRRAQESDTLLAALDSADGLVPMATDSTASLYRIDGAGGGRAARVVVRDGDERHIVPVRGPHARVSTTLPSGDAQRRLVVSAGNDFAREAEVTLDGRALEAVAGTQMPTYSVGADGGKLVIEPGTAWPAWRVAQLVLLGLVVFLAVPFGSARGRGRQ